MNAFKLPTPAAPATLGFGLPVARVIGSVLGSGIFALPQNMAAGAGAGAILIGWPISGVGMLVLGLVVQALAAEAWYRRGCRRRWWWWWYCSGACCPRPQPARRGGGGRERPVECLAGA